MLRYLLIPIAVLIAAFGIVYVAAGRAAAPAIQILQPGKLVGQDATLVVTLEAPRGAFRSIDITLEQKGRSLPLFSSRAPGETTVRQETPDRIRITRPIGHRAIPELQAGPARIVVTASRSVLHGLRTPQATASQDIEVRLAAPRIGVVSAFHYINLGGSEMVVYRATPADVQSGVMVGKLFYPGYPASGAGVSNADPSLKVAFFALLYDQDLNTPISLYARDEAGNQAHAGFDYRVFEKKFIRSKIDINDQFLQRVVPEILEHSPEIKASANNDLLADFLNVNRELRRIDTEKIETTAKQTAPEILWKGPFIPLTNAAIESKFADHRTYFYQGREIDQQVHLGFDLAVTVNIPVRAGNDGKVIWADYLGIYGNCIIVDHGMDVQSLYGHLASIDVRPGDLVKKDQVMGRSGMTGLAGGDHLHFSVLVGGRPVNPVEWWDPHWIEDRVMRKLREAAGGTPPAPGR
jgi:murein DD-endopeptidase MepM/ murein hydrolase activator NlpD